MVPDRTPLRNHCLTATAAWLIFGAVYVSIGSSAATTTACDSAAGRQMPAGAATAQATATHHGRVVASGTMGRATKVFSLGRFVADLRQPRPPRHRSERPTTGADGIEAIMTASSLRLMLQVDQQQLVSVSEPDGCRPLMGHYRSLLRPPSTFS